MLSSTIVSKQEQTLEVIGVAQQLDIKREGPFLAWTDGTRVLLPEPLLQVLALAAHAMMRNQGVTLVLRSNWLTTREAAELIGCSRQQVVDLIERKKLKASKIGTHRRIQLSDLLAFIDTEEKNAIKPCLILSNIRKSLVDMMKSGNKSQKRTYLE